MGQNHFPLKILNVVVMVAMPSCRAINKQSRTHPFANNNMFNCIITYLPTISINKISLVNNLSFFQFFQQLVKMSDVPLCFFLYLFPYNIATEADKTVLGKQKWTSWELFFLSPKTISEFTSHGQNRNVSSSSGNNLN